MQNLANEKSAVEQSRTVEPVQHVIVTNVKMAFWSMVGFQVKWVIASIPALIILLFLLLLLAAVLSMMFGGALLGLEGLFGRF